MANATCSIDQCDETTRARGLCNRHYLKWRRYGDPNTSRQQQRTWCKIEGCDRPTHGHRLCGKHYLRWYHHGDPEWEPLTYQQCTIPSCTKPPRTPGNPLCSAHYYRVRRHGDPHTVLEPPRTSDPAYRTVHGRLAADLGPARDRTCIDCGRDAEHWSYNHTDPDPRYGTDDGLPYSDNPDHYSPRCIPCHKTFDRNNIDAAPSEPN